MNDDTDKPLNTVGDDALEARITAWVLGEASSFEAGELEKLCAADPALGLFERRLRVLHGLVAEDFKTGPAAEWMLSESKRTKITDLLGVEPEVERKIAARKSKSRGPSMRGLILALAACVVFGIFSISLIGGVGQSAKHSMMKESARVATYSAEKREYSEQALAQLDKAIATQKDVVEDKRKLLSQVIRQEGIIYQGDKTDGRGSAPGQIASSDAVSEGIANRTFVDAKNDFESSQRLLETLQTKEIAEKMQSKITEDRLVINDVQPAMGLGTAERSSGVPAKKPDSAYSHLATNSAFTTKPPPPAMRATQEARQTAASGLALDGVDRSNPGLGAGGPLPSAAPVSGSASELQALALNERQSAVKAKESAAQLSGHVVGYVGGGLHAEGAPPLASRSNDDFISTVEGVTIPGVPAATGTTVAPALTAGNRSGDAAITRNNIDAILNHPDRAAGTRQEGEGIAALTGAFSDEAIAQVEKKMAEAAKPAPPASSMAKVAAGTLGIDAIPAAPARPAEVEGKDDGLKAWTGSFSNGAVATDEKAMEELAGAKGRAGAVESEFVARNPKGWLVAGKATDAGLGGGSGGGMPPEAQSATFFNMNGTSESRFKSDLRLGSERVLGRGDASNFGDLDAMGRLAGEAKPQQDLDYFDSKSASQVVGGGADLSDLARKQNEMVPPPAQLLDWAASSDSVSVREYRLREEGSADPFADTPPPAGQPAMIGGLKRDLSVEPVPADAPATPAPAATGDFDGSVNYGAPIQSEIADESKKGRLRGITEMDARDVTIEALTLSKNLEIAPAPTGDEDRAQLLEEVDRAWELSVPSDDKPAAAEPAAPADPLRTSPPLTAEHARMIDEVRRKLYIAEGASNLGKYDESQKTYEEVLRIDPYNKAARRGMEKVAAAKSDYYRAAYDQTRAELLVETDKAGIVAGSPFDGSRGFNASEGVSPEFVIRTITELEKERRQWREQIETLEKSKDGALIQHASGLAIPDNVLPVLVPQLQDARRQLDAMRSSGLGPSHPSVAALSKNVESMDRDVKEAIENLKATLAVKSELAGEKVRLLALKLEPATRESVLARVVAPVVAKSVIVEPTAETLAADEPFSTFSLHVSDASFKLAQAAMERGEVPAAEGIRPEEFYNAFDYGDPAPASGEPVVCVTEQSAHPAFAQRNLLRIGVRTGSQGRGASTPLNLTLLLDHSGSMEREDRNAGLAMAVRQLSGLLKEGDTITVAGFSRQPRLLADRLPGARAQELNDLIERTPSEGGTNLEEGLKLGEELAKRQFNPAAQNRVVLFTDGAANLGDARPEALQARIEGLRQQGISFDAAGFGADGLNDKLLERLTRNGNGRYYIVDGPEDADAGFAKQLAGAFRPAAENVKVQVRFNPARVAKYKLIGFEEHRLQKEDFRNDAVDAAEMAAEEAGNALYQIETLPQGEGEVGEVSVRFRDVASGQMVERTWTIPYDAQAPAFDNATPSIQLAGLAAFTAEKLRAAPMADAVDFQQLGQVYAGVRARYPNSQPVADLGSMIGKMK